MIDTASLSAWTIAEVLARCPEAASVFTRLRMACVGCPVAPFETPVEAARAYGLDPEALLEALRGAAASEIAGLADSNLHRRSPADRRRTDDE